MASDMVGVKNFLFITGFKYTMNPYITLFYFSAQWKKDFI
jgi:hypothetical protein